MNTKINLVQFLDNIKMFHLALFVVLLSLKNIIGLYCNLQFANNENNGIHTRIIHFKISNSLTVIYLAIPLIYILLQ